MAAPAPHPGSDPQPAAGGTGGTGGADGLRVAVIGARRVRHGTGPFLARQAAAAGARVEAVLGTRPASARQAAEELAADGIPVRPYVDDKEMFEDLRPQAVIIASPVGTHRPWLQAALDHAAHAFCEKPLLGGPAEQTRELARRFAAAELLLAENCQWPYALPAFRALHPDVDLAQATHFRMRMAPTLRGIARWQETLSHPLSMLQAVAPGPAELENVHFEEVATDAPDARLHFRYVTLQQALDCEILCEDLGEWPRAAGFGFDDADCRRRVDSATYAQQLETGDPEDLAPGAAAPDGGRRAVPLPDPMEACLRAFLVRAAALVRGEGVAGLDEDLVRRQALLARLLDAYRGQVRS